MAHADGAGRVVLERERDVIAEFAGAMTGFSTPAFGPARRGEPAVDAVRTLVDRISIEIISLDIEIATTAAKIRAAHRALRLLDALIIASAIEQAADHLITTDRKWPTAKALTYKGTITRL